MADVDINEAAKRLGLSARRVRAMADAGHVHARKVGARWLIDSSALVEFASRESSRRAGRPFSASHALGILFLASKEPAPWLSDYERWRIRRYALPRLPELLPRLQRRARVIPLRAAPPSWERISEDHRLIRSGVSAAAAYGAKVLARDVVDGYLPADAAESLIYRWGLVRAPELSANVILRAYEPQIQLPRKHVMPLFVVASDLADSADARTRRAGRELLTDFVDNH